MRRGRGRREGGKYGSGRQECGSGKGKYGSGKGGNGSGVVQYWSGKGKCGKCGCKKGKWEMVEDFLHWRAGMGGGGKVFTREVKIINIHV